MTTKELSEWGTRELVRAKVSEPRSSALFLLRHVLNFSRAELLTHLEQKISSKDEKQFRRLIRRRKKHEPVWQIVGAVEFWGREFIVNKNVLVPRPETEFLIEAVIGRPQAINQKSLAILDVGTGSGAIAVTLAKGFPKSRVTAVDVSERALRVARKNAKKIGAKNIQFLKSNLLSSKRLKKYNIVTANLPYIPTEDLGDLALDIHHHEPRLALDGGPGGLVLYESFLGELPEHLLPGAIVYCEIGAGQGKEFKGLVKKYLPGASCTVKKDYGSFDRLAIITANSEE